MKDIMCLSHLFHMSNPTELLKLTGLLSAVLTAPTENGFVRTVLICVFVESNIHNTGSIRNIGNTELTFLSCSNLF